MKTKYLEGLLLNLNLLCKHCYQEKAIIVDRNKPIISVPTLESDGKVRTRQCYPTHCHPLYCPYHAREGVPKVGKES